MAAVVSATPASQAVNQYIDVTGTGGSSAKNRLKLDGVVVWGGCTDTTFETTIQLGAAAGTSTIDWEQYLAGTWTSVDTFSETVTSSGGGTAAQFPGTGPSTAAALTAMMTNNSIRIIEIAAGTYSQFHVYIRNTRGSANSLTVRPAPGAAVIFDGASVAGADGVFYFGADNGGAGYPGSVTDYITIDAAGTGGSFAFANYHIGSTGLVYTGWSDHITVNGITVTGFDGVISGGGFYNQSHAVYVSEGGSPGHATTNLTANGWNVTGVSRHVNGLQTFHEPQGATRTAHTWTVTLLNHWALIYGNSGSLVDIDGWNGTNCNATIDSPSGQAISGTVKNCNGHGSCGTLALGSGLWTNTNLANGGGNVA
jgi:hypothetical protein